MIITSLAKKRKGSPIGREIVQKHNAISQILELNCQICALPFNSRSQLPIAFCPEEHTFCSECVSNLFSRQPNGTIRCPTCRVFVYHHATHINKTLLRICDSIPKLAEEYLILQRQKEEIERKLEEVSLFVSKKENKNKENVGILGNEKEQFNGFPLIRASQYINKPNKMNIHSYVAQRRRAVSKSEGSQELKLEINPNIKKMI